MNPWEGILVLFGWVAYALIASGALIILFALWAGAWGWVQKARKAKKATRERFDRERQAIALDMFRHNQIPPEPVDAFKAGAEWSRGFHTRK